MGRANMAAAGLREINTENVNLPETLSQPERR